MNLLPKVLIVDDSAISRAMLRKILEGEYELLEAENGSEAVAAMRDGNGTVDAVILDIVMPVMDGFEFLRTIRKDILFEDVPVIAVTGAGIESPQKKAFQVGATEFFEKPFNPDIIKQRLHNLILLRKALKNAQTDSLTNLLNRSAFAKRADEYLDAHSSDGSLAALLMIDIDDFKHVNDTFGHLSGDMALSEFALTLKHESGANAIVGRLGGDEFVILLKGISEKAFAKKIAEAILYAVDALCLDNGSISISCSIGIALFPEDGSCRRDLYICADKAMYDAKLLGKNRHSFYDKKSRAINRGLSANTAKDTAVSFITEYLINRNAKNAAMYLTDNVEYISSGAFERADTRKAAEELLSNQILSSPNSYRAEFLEQCEKKHAPEISVIFSRIRVSEIENDATMDFLVTMTCIKIGGIFKICSLHSSAPPNTRCNGDFSPGSSCFFKEKPMLLKKSSSEFLRVYDAMPTCFFFNHCQPNYPLYMMNQYALDFLGYDSVGEYIASTGGLITSVMHPSDADATLRSINAQLAEGDVYNVTYRLRKKDGTYAWVNNKGRAFIGDDGRKILVSACEDITYEHDLNVQVKLYRAAQKGGVFTIALDEYFTLLYGNDIFYQLLGYTKESMLERLDNRCSRYIHPVDFQLIHKSIFDAFAAKAPVVEYSMRIITGDNTLKYVFVSGTFDNLDGEDVMHGFVIDITKQKLLERQLKKANAELERMYNSIPGGIFHCLFNDDLTLLFANDGLFRFLGYTRAEFKERFHDSLSRIVYPEDLARTLSAIKARIPQGSTMQSAQRLICKDGAVKWISVHAELIADECGLPSLYCVFVDITEQKSAEQALVESERRYSIATGGADMNVWEYDLCSKRLIHSKRSARTRNLDDIIENVPDSIVERGYIREDSINDFVAMFARLSAGEEKVSADIWFKAVDGMSWWCERITYSLALDADGRPSRAFGVSCDITQDKKLEKHFYDEMAYREAIQSTTVLSLNVNLSQNTVSNAKSIHPGLDNAIHAATADQMFENIMGLISEKELRLQYSSAFSRKALMSSFSNGQYDVALAIPIFAASSSIRWLSLNARLVQKDQMNDVEAIIFATDITEEKVVKMLMNAVITIDYDFIVLVDALRNKATRYSGKPSVNMLYSQSSDNFEQETEKYIYNCVVAEDASRLAADCKIAHLLQKLDDDGAYETTYTVKATDGATLKKRLTFRYINKKYRVFMMARTDITAIFAEQERKSHEMEDTMRLATQANLAKSEFLAKMSHEIRTPMNAIIGMIYIADMQLTPEASSAHDALKQANASANYLMALLNDILDTAKIESGKMKICDQPFALSDVISEVKAMLYTSANEKNIFFRVDTHELSHNYYFGDTLRIKQILMNLLSNAVKFTQSGGVTLCVKSIAPEVNGERDSVVFTVSDTGIGMSAEYAGNLFGAFEQESHLIAEKYGGSGLGLSIAKSLVDLMHGSISVSSKQGNGSAFTVSLPLARTDNRADDAPATPRLDPCLRECRVLVAEDHPINMRLILRLLELRGISADCAENGEDAVKKFLASPCRLYSLILMDLQMPKLNGYEAARAIRSSSHPQADTIPIVAMSANAYSSDREKSIACGMNEHIAKPIEPNLLYKTIGRYI